MTAAFYTNAAQSRNNILLRGYDEQGRRVQKRVPYKPYLFVNPGNEEERQSTPYRALIDGAPLSRIDFDSMSDARNFISDYKDVGSMPIHGFNRWVYTFLNDTYPGLNLEYDFSLIRVCYLDIEVRSNEGFPKVSLAAQEVTAITLFNGKKFIVWGLKEYEVKREDVEYRQFYSEKGMLEDFVNEFRHSDFDIVSGWNVEGFDLPYLVRRITKVLGEDYAKKLSPWEQLEERTYFDRNGRENEAVDLVGIATLDFLQLYLKFHLGKQESYKLGYIGQVEVGETKVEYEAEYGDLEGLYQRNHQLFIDYNIKDVELVMKLEKKLKYIELAMSIAYDAKVNFTDATTSVLLWDVIIHNHLFVKNIIVPPQTRSHKESQVRGAFVKEPRVGRYNWVLSFDLDSLYPHLIMGSNISPETFVGVYPGITPEFILNNREEFEKIREGLLKHNLAICGNGAMFKRDKRGILPELMDSYYADRKRYKKMMLECQDKLQHDPNNAELKAKVIQYNNIQGAKKVTLNSAYGALLNQYFRYYNDALGEAVTLTGQVAIQWVSDRLNRDVCAITGQDKDYVIANDTDSAYIDLGDVVKMRFKEGIPSDKMQVVTFLDKLGKARFEPVINSCYDELSDLLNSYEQRMRMKRESIAEVAIWTGAKRYVMLVWDSEGVIYRNKKTGLPEPKMKMTGIDAVRSSTPTICRSAIEDGARIILDGDQQKLYDFVAEFKAKFQEAATSQIARNSSVQNLAKYMNAERTGNPNVAGSIVYNRLLDKLNLGMKYPRIQDGDRIKYVALKLPNPAQSKWIAFPDAEIPEEFGLAPFVDIDAQLEVGFMSGLQSIAEAGGMNLEVKASLADFFV